MFACCAIKRVVLGGGVMKTQGLLERIISAASEADADYLPGRKIQMAVSPQLGEDAGVAGALILAEDAVSCPINDVPSDGFHYRSDRHPKRLSRLG